MSLENSHRGVEPASAPPAPKRDALGRLCLGVHILALGYIAIGWLAPWRAGSIAYLTFLPVMVLQWKLNRNACVLNNLESLARSGRWRNPENREEGAWLRTLVNGATGWKLSRSAMDVFIYSALAALWLLAFARLKRWF